MNLNPAVVGVSEADLDWARAFLHQRANAPASAPTPAPVAPAPPGPGPDAVRVLVQELASQTAYVQELVAWSRDLVQQQQAERAQLTEALRQNQDALEAVLDRLTTPTTETAP